MKLNDIILEQRTYKGDALEKGGTSIQGAAAPAIRSLFKQEVITPGMKVLDYGAGKYGRNSNFLRKNGVKVYAFDPYNGTGTGGWKGTSKNLPKGEKFDIVISSFVLNVVPEHIEDNIIAKMNQFSPHQIHITRNLDIFDSVKKMLDNKNKIVCNFFINEFANKEQKKRFETNSLELSDIMDFVYFGVQTSRGFQRIPILDSKGFQLVKKTHGYKVFEKGNK